MVAKFAKPSVEKKLIKNIENLTKKDYTVKLGSILEEEKRRYYTKENFKILKAAIRTAYSV